MSYTHLESHHFSDSDYAASGVQITPSGSGSELTFEKSSSSSSESLPLEDSQDEHLWFSDGDIVLATSDADDSRLFRVHKGVLAQHSMVFKDMFNFPAPSPEPDDDENDNAGDDTVTMEDDGGDALKIEESENGMEKEEKEERYCQETYGGLPLVLLPGDRGQDIGHLLRAMYEPEYYNPNDDTTPLETITALLLLSNKYDAPRIRAQVIKHLLRHYPTTLSEFDAADDNERDLFGRNRVDCHFALLRAVLKADVDILLPGLYYACAAIPIAEIFDEEASTLELGTLKTLLVGARKLEAAIRTLLHLTYDSTFIRQRILACPGRGGAKCKIEMKERSYELEAKFNTTRFFDVRGEEVVRLCVKNGTACAVCRANIASGVDDVRRVHWSRVPDFFGLPNWKKLRATVGAEDESEDSVRLGLGAPLPKTHSPPAPPSGPWFFPLADRFKTSLKLVLNRFETVKS